MRQEIQEVLVQCDNVLPRRMPGKPMKVAFQELADALTGDEMPDAYGVGEYLAMFEAEIAELFDKEAAVFMPSGTMAQQIALRIWCEQRHNFTVAMHPTAHLETAEHAGYQFLHHIRRLQFGAPESLRYRLLKAADFEELGQTPGATLLEMPYRPLGGKLPTWEELVAIREWALAKGIPLHMDGARIWQCRPFYQKSYAEIAALFDSVYVSFYKDVGGLCGSALLGSVSFIQEARVWQRRHGGNLRTQSPYVVSARLGVQRIVPQIDSWVQRTQELAAILTEFEQITIQPDPPHVNFFLMYIRGDAKTMLERHLALARETGTFLFYGLNSSPVPGIAFTQLGIEESGMAFDLTRLRPFITQLLA